MRPYLSLASGPLSLLLAGALLSSACQRGGSAADDDQAAKSDLRGHVDIAPPDVPAHVDGTPDKASDGRLRLDEKGMRATLSGTTLDLAIPASSETDLARGTLTVELTTAEGGDVLDQRELEYRIEGGETTTLSAQLTLPKEAADQTELVNYNLRVRAADDTGVYVVRSAFALVPRFEAQLVGPARVSANRRASYRVRAQDPETQEAVVGAAVTLQVTSAEAAPRLLKGTTDAQGDAFFALDVAAGSQATLAATVSNAGGPAQLFSAVSVESSGARVLLTTDKPLYQPGQLVNLRALALKRQGNAPQENQAVLFEIEDGKANKVLKRSVQSDGFGIAATTFRLGTLVNMGTFKVRAVMGSTTSERTFEVARYALPKFKLDVVPDKSWYRAGDVVKLGIDARYFFGKNVANAEVVVDGSTSDLASAVFQRVMGKADAQGHLEVLLPLPPTLIGLPLQQGNALVSLALKVTDAAGQVVEKSLSVVVSTNTAQLTLVPEGTTLVPGVDNQLLAFVTDPVGAPVVGASVQLVGGEPVQTDAFGQAVLTLPAAANVRSLQAMATLPGGGTISQTFNFAMQAGTKHVLVRSDRAVYALGETVKVELISDAASDNIYVEWQNEGQTIEQRTIKAKNGKGSFEVALDSARLGSNRIEAYVVDAGGTLVRAGRTLFVRSDSALAVALSTDKPQYLPGEPAKLTFSVKDQSGAPQVAALGVQIVDEALFALSQATPGLLRSYFELNDEFATPHYQFAVPPASLPGLVFDETRQGTPAAINAAQQRAQALFCGVGSNMVTGLHLSSWPSTKEALNNRLAALMDTQSTALSARLGDTIKKIVAALKFDGCMVESGSCSKLSTTFSAALASKLRSSTQVIDPWGQPYTVSDGGSGIVLSSAGPDEVDASWDDARLRLPLSVWGLSPTTHVGGSQVPTTIAAAGSAGAGGVASAGTSTGSTATTAAPSDDGAATRVRRDFPETLYVNPAVITGPDGKATLEVPLADSITQWRVSSLANSKDGKLGGATHGLKVFQEFFADINFPAQLTRGDEIRFPIAVYNYLEQPQTVMVTLETGGWYTAQGATSASVDLLPNAVGAVSFPVRVDQVGLQTLRVRAQGSARSDVIERKVRVVADGKRFSSPQSGSLGQGSVSASVSIPADSVPGSAELALSIYPALTSSVVSGMDSMLQAPYGCFEQTTSTTWPNVLVQRYLGGTGQLSTATKLKAEAYISAGYQRLVTFEHPNGGFSWFGTQDPKPYLSVTAFGVMEFVDMAQVYPVDPAMLARTVAWLSAQQQPDGTFQGDQTEFFSFHTSILRNTAFVVWALATAGERSDAVTRALAYLSAHYADEAQDAYTLALVANAFAVAAPASETLTAVVAQLAKLKKSEGDRTHWDTGGTQTQFYAQGGDADVAATALATYALLQTGANTELVKGGLTYLAAARDQAGNFGSTQATIWTLRALLLAATKSSDGAVGTLSVSVDGNPFTNLTLTKDQSDVLTTLDLSSLASVGPHNLLLSFSGTGKLSYNLVNSYNLPWSRVPTPPATPLSVAVSYDRTSLPVNDLVKSTVTVRNLTASTQNMVLVDVGIPPGFELQTDDLDALRSEKRISKYELTTRQLLLYVSTMAPRESLVLTYAMRATLPVKAADGGARVYPYYEPTRQQVSAATVLEAL